MKEFAAKLEKLEEELLDLFCKNLGLEKAMANISVEHQGHELLGQHRDLKLLPTFAMAVDAANVPFNTSGNQVIVSFPEKEPKLLFDGTVQFRNSSPVTLYTL
ncbi:hypothetical protein V6N13_063882 [Hibiscus sabdariffa]|uniref:Uncharacterized protein n=1 Tax=Hibiscus sabdariffa TaxID=183260 RepID=A0ABR2R1H8_9ROSI